MGTVVKSLVVTNGRVQSGTNGTVNLADMTASSTEAVLLGRGEGGGAGPYQDISLGTNLSMAGTTLNATGGSGGITSLNALTDASQTFADVDDTNVTLGIVSAAGVHTFTLGWAGTLADGRIASAATWNAKEPAITATTAADYYRGDKTFQPLNAAAVGAQPLGATLTNLDANNWVLNAIPVGTGADTVSQLPIGANEFPARGSTGNIVARTIQEFAFNFLDDLTSSDVLTTLGLSAFAKTIIDDVDAAAVRATIGAGQGTVTAVSIATANGVSGSSSGGATPALTITLGAITPTSVAATGGLSSIISDAGTTTAVDGLILDHKTSGTPAALFGTRIQFRGETTTAESVTQAYFVSGWHTPTGASYKSQVELFVDDAAGSRRVLRGWADGTNPRFAFAAPASAPTDADIAAGQVSWYLDETSNYLIARCKEAGSTLFSVTLNKPPLVTVYSSGSGTHTTATGCLFQHRELVGSSGGGAGSGTTPGAAGAGGATTFGALSAGGGAAGTTNGSQAAGGTASGGSATTRQSSGGAGQPGATTINGQGGEGGSSFFGGGGWPGLPGVAGGAGTARAGGGGGASSQATANAGGGGGGGAYMDDLIANPASSYSYAVGAAGTAGTAGTGGQAGGVGVVGSIKVTEWF